MSPSTAFVVGVALFVVLCWVIPRISARTGDDGDKPKDPR